MSDLRERIGEILEKTESPLHKDKHGKWFVEKILAELTTDLANYLTKELGNAIFPKYRVGQEVWVIWSCIEKGHKITQHKILGAEYDTACETPLFYAMDNYNIAYERYVYPTKAAAERALKSEVCK